MLIKTLKILQNSVYGWEVVNNHVCSGRSVDNPVTQASLSAERFDLKHPCHTQGREHGDLAANISPTNENPFTNAPLKIYLVLR